MADFDNTPAAPVAIASDAWASVRAASTLTMDIQSLEPGANLGGVTLAEGDRFLLTAQTDPEDNGIYLVEAQGSERAPDADDAQEFRLGRTVKVTEGTNPGTWIYTTAASVTLGTTGLSFERLSAGPAASANTPWADARVALTSGVTDPLAAKAGDTVDGIVLSQGDRLVATASRAAVGIYTVGAGASTRATDANEAGEFVAGRTVRVTAGTNAGRWRLKTAPAVLGTNAGEFEKPTATAISL